MAQICYGCFKTVGEGNQICPFCGYRIHEATGSVHILKPGTVLNQKYTVGRTLGEGGFGITYLAWDNNMQIKIAIKEFYPATLVARDTSSENQTQVYTITQSRSNEFHQGLERFVREASILAQFFNLPGIVSVKDFFYENRTAYIVMEYIEGITLKDYLKQRGGVLSVEETLALMKPVIESLAVIHSHKLLHRDISPDNLMVTADRQVKLIDFGSARYFDTQSDKSMTVVLKHGYAPVEQYSSNGHQGTWTDVYSLCATMYRMLTGTVPDESINRIRTDIVQPIRSLGKKVPGNVAEAIDRGMSVMPEKRQQRMEELYRELYMSRKDFRSAKRNKMYQNINRFLIRLIAGIIVCFLVVVVVWYKRQAIADTVSRAAGKLAADERAETDRQEAPSEQEETEGGTEKEASPAESAAEEEETQAQAASEAAQREEAAQEESVSEAAQEAASQPQDTGSQTYQMMRAGAESASATDDSVVKVRDGRLNNIASDHTVGEILDLYSDEAGQWYTYEAAAQTYVYYEGKKGNSSFVLEFEVYANDTFKLSGAMQDGVAVERYSDFFQEILGSLGY